MYVEGEGEGEGMRERENWTIGRIARAWKNWGESIGISRKA